MAEVERRLLGHPATDPSTENAELQPIAVAADSQVMIRALAEQLVCEANSVLRAHGDTIALVDRCGAGQLAFTIRYADREVCVEMAVNGCAGTSRIVSPPDTRAPQRLRSTAEVGPLILALIEPVELPSTGRH
jgi:hypothetical protein